MKDFSLSELNFSVLPKFLCLLFMSYLIGRIVACWVFLVYRIFIGMKTGSKLYNKENFRYQFRLDRNNFLFLISFLIYIIILATTKQPTV